MSSATPKDALTESEAEEAWASVDRQQAFGAVAAYLRSPTTHNDAMAKLLADFGVLYMREWRRVARGEDKPSKVRP